MDWFMEGLKMERISGKMVMVVLAELARARRRAGQARVERVGTSWTFRIERLKRGIIS